MKRRLVEMLERRKDAMIAALWSNSNYDDDKGTRKSVIADIEDNYNEVVSRILNDNWEQEEDDINDNPFFDSAKRGLAKIAPVENEDEDVTVKEVVDYSKDIDQ